MAKLSPIYVDAQLINGIPANGAKVFTYAAGSSTKQTTYTDENGLVAQANPIILNSRGEPASPIWLTEGQSYKFVFTASTDSDPPTSPIRTIDNIDGVNDASLTLDQWVISGVTPTYVSATQFTVPGDQTSNFTVNRRIKATVTAGTVYGYITASVFGALTTVTVVLDSGVLDSGLSAVQLGVLTPNNPSVPQNYLPPFIDSTAIIKGSADATKLLRVEADGITAATTRVWTAQDIDITPAGISQLGQILPISASVSANAMTLTLNPCVLDFRSATAGSGTVNTRNVTAAITTVISSGSTGGTVSGVSSRIFVLAIDNAGTVELAWINASALFLTEASIITTTAEGGAGAADSANTYYSTTARTGVPFRILGFVDSTQATAGTWATAPSLIQGARAGILENAAAVAGLAPIYMCRAWVNFNGTGTVAIRASGNVSSITDNGTGDYTVNFTTAMQDANYAWVGTTSRPAADSTNTPVEYTATARTASLFRFYTLDVNATAVGLSDSAFVNISVFR